MDIFPYRRNVLTFPTMKLRSTDKSISQYLIQNKNSEGTVLKLKTEKKCTRISYYKKLLINKHQLIPYSERLKVFLKTGKKNISTTTCKWKYTCKIL